MNPNHFSSADGAYIRLVIVRLRPQIVFLFVIRRAAEYGFIFSSDLLVIVVFEYVVTLCFKRFLSASEDRLIILIYPSFDLVICVKFFLTFK